MAADARVEEFRRAAASFRTTLEEAGSVPEFARRVRNAVARVYLAAVFLPQGEAASGHVQEAETARAGEALESRVAHALERDAYAVVWDPLEIDRPDAIVGSMALELGEIYDDLGRALTLLERGSPDDLREVRSGFEEHWGGHAVNMLRPLHHLATGR